MSAICLKTLAVMSAGVFRGCSSQSSVSILLPMMRKPSFWMLSMGAAWSLVSGSWSME
jgi:hypothetical protein